MSVNLLNEIEPSTFSELVMRNTNLGDVTSSHLPGHLFQTPDLILELDQARQIRADPLQDSLILQAIDPKVTRHDPGADIDRDGHADGGYLRISGGDHTVLGGTEGDDTLIGDRGIDTLWGDGGDDLNAGTESRRTAFRNATDCTIATGPRTSTCTTSSRSKGSARSSRATRPDQPAGERLRRRTAGLRSHGTGDACAHGARSGAVFRCRRQRFGGAEPRLHPRSHRPDRTGGRSERYGGGRPR
ncbi:hypothetical protein [uncultured Methylobacterium sp.]|uniref:hypothetical protein n=1 Tax=uncultured Methylobacterium sp. TaxID=157278 RepID=UPI0035CA148D